jgi:hypothetical protein
MPSTSQDTLKHIFEMKQDGITLQEEVIEDIEWAQMVDHHPM